MERSKEMEEGYSDTRRPEVLNLEFTGTAGEYFRIWIVNIALTVVTLGIYGAWANQEFDTGINTFVMH